MNSTRKSYSEVTTSVLKNNAAYNFKRQVKYSSFKINKVICHINRIRQVSISHCHLTMDSTINDLITKLAAQH